MTRSIGLLSSHKKKVAKHKKMGRNPHMLPGYLLLWATIPPSPLYASVEVHRTGAPTVRMGLACPLNQTHPYCHFFAVSITPAVKSSVSASSAP